MRTKFLGYSTEIIRQSKIKGPLSKITVYGVDIPCSVESKRLTQSVTYC